MEYQYAKWIHNSEEYPVHFYSEMNQSRMEVRKIEIWRNGKVGWADSENNFNETFLGSVPIPSLEEINEQIEFDGKQISQIDFEEQWDLIKTK